MSETTTTAVYDYDDVVYQRCLEFEGLPVVAIELEHKLDEKPDRWFVKPALDVPVPPLRDRVIRSSEAEAMEVGQELAFQLLNYRMAVDEAGLRLAEVVASMAVGNP